MSWLAAGAATLSAGYVVFALVRLGVLQRLPLVLGPISLERIPDRAARKYGDRPLFSCDRPPEWSVLALKVRYPDGTQWSALRIRDTAGYLAAFLRNTGVQRGDRVAILKRNHFDIHLLTAGVVRCGGIACPMNGCFAADKLSPYLANIGARVLITDLPTLGRVVAEGGDLGAVQTVVVAAARRGSEAAEPRMLEQLGITVLWLEDELSRVTAPASAMPRGAGDPTYLVHSSGTTGFPKAVTLLNGAQSHAVRGWLSYVHLSRSRDRGLVAVPNNHQAVILSFNSALLLGLPIHWWSACRREDFEPVAVAAELARGKYTGFFAFPIAYTLLKEVDWSRFDVPAMRFWASTADAAHAAVERVFVQLGGAFRSLGLPLRGSIYLDAQGSSEVGTPSVVRYLTAYTRNFDRRIGRPGSTPFGPRVRVAVDGVPVRRGEVGRLEVKGRTLFAGYWNNDTMTYAAFRDGWFFTGDVARQESDGHLIQLDREVDVIQGASGPVYSLPIEERLHTHPAVFDICVYGARQPDGTQAPAAAIALRPAIRVTEQQLLRELNQLLEPRERLVTLQVMPWSEFPIGITGKTLKRVFRERTERRVPPEMNRPIVSTELVESEV
jgi:acyl-coenzyme A synthetase/AMP-(fatty) acid ligase